MLTAFTASLLLITISELGDKTFCIAMLLAMRHPRRLVFVGVVAALAAMTLLSVALGQTVSLLPQRYVEYAEVALFLGFGLKLIYDAWRMSPLTCEVCEQDEALALVNAAEAKTKRQTMWAILSESFTLTFIAEWGDRTQITTIALAAANNLVGVTAGAVLGHAICAAIAVIGGKLIAGRISERTVTFIGGLLFVIFGTVAAIEMGLPSPIA